MNTATNLLVILIFLAGFYTFLGLICSIVEKTGELLAQPRQRRRVRRSTRLLHVLQQFRAGQQIEKALGVRAVGLREDAVLLPSGERLSRTHRGRLRASSAAKTSPSNCLHYLIISCGCW